MVLIHLLVVFVAFSRDEVCAVDRCTDCVWAGLSDVSSCVMIVVGAASDNVARVGVLAVVSAIKDVMRCETCDLGSMLDSVAVIVSLEDGCVGTGADTDAGFLGVSLVAVCLVVRLALRAAAFFCRGVVEFAGFLG